MINKCDRLSIKIESGETPIVAEYYLILRPATLDQVIRQVLRETLNRMGGVRVAAARELGINEKTVRNYMRRYGWNTPAHAANAWTNIDP